MSTPLLEIENLTVRFSDFVAVDRFSLTLEAGELLGVVGESGSGKSVSMLALMGLVGYPGVITADKLLFNGRDMLDISNKDRRKIIGKEISMIFQEPMTSLNPSFTVGYQMMESLRTHVGGSRKELHDRVVDLLQQVGIPDPARRLGAFPHQLSGGMCQRVMIAMAIACQPKLLIADEPTTALDVTIQAQILDLLISLQEKHNMALILVTHDMGVIAETAETVRVMYAGQLVETRPVNDLFNSPRHPYTRALISALPERNVNAKRLPTIPGIVPGPFDRPEGCLFNPRCQDVADICHQQEPEWNPTTNVRCHFGTEENPS